MKDSQDKPGNIRAAVYQQFKTIFSADMFTKLQKYNVAKPDPEIVELVQNISNGTSTNIKDYLYEYFKPLLHKRVGSLLMVSEKNNVNPNELQSSIKVKLLYIKVDMMSLNGLYMLEIMVIKSQS